MNSFQYRTPLHPSFHPSLPSLPHSLPSLPHSLPASLPYRFHLFDKSIDRRVHRECGAGHDFVLSKFQERLPAIVASWYLHLQFNSISFNSIKCWVGGWHVTIYPLGYIFDRKGPKIFAFTPNQKHEASFTIWKLLTRAHFLHLTDTYHGICLFLREVWIGNEKLRQPVQVLVAIQVYFLLNCLSYGKQTGIWSCNSTIKNRAISYPPATDTTSFNETSTYIPES